MMKLDITKCTGEGCPIKNQCYRFTAEGNPLYQSWLVEIPGKWHEDILNKEVWECNMFWGVELNKTINDIFGK